MTPRPTSSRLAATATGAVALFFAVLAFLAVRMAGGHDPALGASVRTQKAAVRAPVTPAPAQPAPATPDGGYDDTQGYGDGQSYDDGSSYGQGDAAPQQQAQPQSQAPLQSTTS
jgi:hypothetical protein